MKKGLIVKNGYFDNEATLSQRKALIDAFKNLGVTVEEKSAGDIKIKLSLDGVESEELNYDFCIFLDKDYYLAKMLEIKGLKLFNSAESIRLCDDKAITYLTLTGKGIKMPKTVFAPLMYVDSEDKAFLEKVKNEFSFPIVVKSVYGSMGKGVFLAKNEEELSAIYTSLKKTPHFYQEFTGKRGEDIRIITVGGKVVSAMKRINENDFRSNIDLGGRGEKVKLTKNQIKLAEKVSKILKLDYSGIDVLGEDILCEVNSNAFFKEVSKVTKIDVAKAYAEYIYKTVY